VKARREGVDLPRANGKVEVESEAHENREN